MTKAKRKELLSQHITVREMVSVEIVMILLYLGTALQLPTDNFWWFLFGCAVLCVAFGEIRNQLLMWLNDRRMTAAKEAEKEVEPEVSSDDD